jgi:ubiquinone/menaquinone biosynthesis C-methylase UbiE
MKDSVAVAEEQKHYLPAAGRDVFLPFYDIVTRLTGSDRARQALLDQADLRPGQQVLDVGCGTGTLAILVKRRCPRIEVVALDPDPKALARAKRKARRAGVFPQFDQGFSDELGYPASSFDHVFSSFMFHHLERQTKARTLQEIRRVLKPGGQLHLVDFVVQDSAGGLLSHLFHSHAQLADHMEERILALVSGAGLADGKVVARRSTFFGLARVAYYTASAPRAAASVKA